MKLKNKIVTISIISIVVFCAMTLYIQKVYVLPTYSKIERFESSENLWQTYVLVQRDIKSVEFIAKDIAESKKTYLAEKDQPLAILDTDVFDKQGKKNNAGIILVFNNRKELIYKQLQSGIKEYNIEMLSKYIINYNLLYYKNDKATDSHTGLISTSEGIVITASVPIYNQENKRMIGSVVVCQPLNRNYFRLLSKQIKSSVYIYDLNHKSANLPLDQNRINILKNTLSIYFDESSPGSNFSVSYRIMSDINKKPTFLLATRLSRSVYLEAHSMIIFTMKVFIIFGILLIFVITNIIQLLVVKPISKLTKSTIKIRESEDLMLRTKFQFRKDEIGILSIEFNNLLEQIQHHIEDMEDIIKEKTNEIRSTREDTIFRLSMAIDDKDVGAGKHMKRVQKMMVFLAEKLNYRKNKCEMYGIAGTLHDIGKIGVPEYILGKTGKYTKDEYEAMKSHTTIGGKIFSSSDSQLVVTARQIAMYHHENWDGTGYPEGLKGKDIPLPARMMTIIDIFNAMLSKRTYKKSLSLDEVINHFRKNSGKIFDPEILKIFIDNIDKFVEIRKQHPDSF